MLTSLREYDSIRDNARKNATVTRFQNLDILTTPSGETIGICHLAVMMPFSRVLPDQRRVPFPHGYQAGFATALAAHHLNTGNGTIIPEVNGLNERCGIRFTMELIDSELFQSPAVKATLNILNRVPGEGRLPTAFIGNTRSPVSMATSVITGLAGYPQVSPYSVTNELNDKSQHPLFSRLIPDSDGHALPIVQFFRNVLGARHLAVVHNNDGYGDAYARAVLKTAQEYTPDLKVEFIDLPVKSQPDDYVKAVAFLRSTRFRFFFAPVLNVNFEPLMEEAFRQNIAGDGLHNWMFSASIETAMMQQYEKDSPLHLATRGISIINVIGGKEGISTRGKYEESWDALNNNQDIDYIVSKLPQHDNYDSSLFINDAFFGSRGSVADTFSYDSAVLLGLAACAAAGEKKSQNNNNTAEPPDLDGQSHYKKALDIQFQGVTGDVVLESSTGSRDPVSAYFELLNFYFEDDSTNSSVVKLNQRQSYVFENGTWDQVTPWFFNDETSTIPSDLPEVSVNMNYIGTALRGIGLAFACIILILSIGFSAWSHCHFKSRVVRASQPIFLDIVCVGIFIMGTAIIPLSFDDEIASDEACSIGCMLVPCLLCIGFSTTFSALLAKTWRVNKIFHTPTFTRIKVTPFDVMKPLFVSLAANIIILSVWLSISPLIWQREVNVVDVFDRVIESHGSCRSSDSSSLYFVISLTIVNISVLLLAVYQAYVARNIATEFAESEHIAKALSLILLVSFVAIPVMVIVTDEPKASFFALTSVITVLCISVLLFIFVPKMIYRKKETKQRVTMAINNSINYSRNYSGSVAHVNNSSVDYTSTSMDSEADEGERILFHPNMRQDLLNQVTKLKRRIQQLESQQKREAATSEEYSIPLKMGEENDKDA